MDSPGISTSVARKAPPGANVSSCEQIGRWCARTGHDGQARKAQDLARVAPARELGQDVGADRKHSSRSGALQNLQQVGGVRRWRPIEIQS